MSQQILMRLILAGMVVGMTHCKHTRAHVFEGIYTRESSGTFSKAFDTLVIYPYNETGMYLIRRKTGFVRYKQGIAQPEEYRSEEMITTMDSPNQLVDRKTGRLFSFSEEGLLFGTAEYRRVK